MSRRFSDKRKYETKSERKVVYIYSEGTVTEKNYFVAIKRELRLPQINIEPIGTGYNTYSLVEYVLTQKGSNGQDVFWVVFDKDDHSNFDKAIQTAEANGIGVAYSNECFELWFILHFEYLQSALGRKNLQSNLTKLLSTKYRKNMDIYSLVKDKESIAVANAKKLEVMHRDMGVTSHENRVPGTTVYKLVEYLRSLKFDGS